MFDDGKGIVEKLISDFPSFDNSVIYKGKLVRLDKRAQLGPGILFGKFQNEGLFQVVDEDKLTVFADYTLPKGLNNLGILVYSKGLKKTIDNNELIKSGSRKELEIRALTIHASDKLIEKINQYGDKQINALHLDYKLWSESRVKKGLHHLTITTAY